MDKQTKFKRLCEAMLKRMAENDDYILITGGKLGMSAMALPIGSKLYEKLKKEGKIIEDIKG